MRGSGPKTMLAAIAVLLTAGGAFLLLRDADGEPGWTSGSARVMDHGSCSGDSVPDFGFPPVMGTHGSRPGVPVPYVFLRGMDGSIVRTGQYYGVGLADGTQRQITRDWRLEGRMLALDEKGEVVEEVSHDKVPRRRGRMTTPQMNMRVGEEPGTYLLEVRIAGAGRRSGRYVHRIEAVPPHGEARLAIDGRSFRVGEKVMARIENLGTEPVQYGEDKRLERMVDGEWSPVPEERVVQLWAAGVQGGEVSRCEPFRLESSLDSGRYRLVKNVSTRKEPRGYHDHTLTAEFRVLD
ncbi:MAG TPA: immunoglobulin-like domain-containing protein [Solirubrobacterales bacterium]|nr:immunoglobulin-like domain-containing protein [Solirubrobacterales bacterium]